MHARARKHFVSAPEPGKIMALLGRHQHRGPYLLKSCPISVQVGLFTLFFKRNPIDNSGMVWGTIDAPMARKFFQISIFQSIDRKNATKSILDGSHISTRNWFLSGLFQKNDGTCDRV